MHIALSHVAGVHAACYHHERSRLAQLFGGGDVAADASGHGAALVLSCRVAEDVAELGCGIHAPHRERLDAYAHARLVGTRRPVEEDVGTEAAHAVDREVYLVYELGDIVAVALQQRSVGMVHPPVVLYDEIPERIGGHVVEPAGQRKLTAGEVERPRHHVGVAEDGVDGGHLGVHVAYPHQAVALDAVPEKLLHAQLYGVGSCEPDGVEPAVAATERTHVGEVAIAEDGGSLLDGYGDAGAQQVDAHKSEARVAYLHLSVARYLDHDVALGVVVGGIAHAGLGVAGVAHTLLHRLAEAYAHERRFGAAAAAHGEAESAVELPPIVERDRGGVALGAGEQAHAVAAQFGLAVGDAGEHVGAGGAVALHHPHRGEVDTRDGVGAHAGGVGLGENGGKSGLCHQRDGAAEGG